MQRTRRMGVIEIKRMGERAVNERRRRRRVGAPIAHHRARAACQSEFLDRRDKARRRLRVVARADHDAREVQNQPLGALGDFFWQISKCQFRHKTCQLLRDFSHTPVPPVQEYLLRGRPSCS